MHNNVMGNIKNNTTLETNKKGHNLQKIQLPSFGQRYILKDIQRVQHHFGIY